MSNEIVDGDVPSTGAGTWRIGLAALRPAGSTPAGVERLRQKLAEAATRLPLPARLTLPARPARPAPQGQSRRRTDTAAA